jgi:hypothetical protein
MHLYRLASLAAISLKGFDSAKSQAMGIACLPKV